jgi:hypothetical protein
VLTVVLPDLLAPSSCDDVRMRRLWLLIPACVLALSAPALASASDAQLWTALGRNVTCGIAIHPVNSPPMQLLCGARPVPAPKTKGIGDPGFVFLGSTGRPSLARLSQDSFVGTNPVALNAGSKWSVGPIDVTCTVGVKTVRCVNRSRHGFTITKSSYHSF